jgi:hypothetical protein
MNHGGMTIAFRSDNDGFIEYAVAACSERDNFNRAIGRIIATNRLLKRAKKTKHCITNTFPSNNVKEFVTYCHESWNKV